MSRLKALAVSLRALRPMAILINAKTTKPMVAAVAMLVAWKAASREIMTIAARMPRKTMRTHCERDRMGCFNGRGLLLHQARGRLVEPQRDGHRHRDQEVQE